MDEFEQEDGISLLDILRVMFGRKILLLIITISIGLIGTIAILFGFNKLKGKYVADFTYSDANFLENKYVDGASFNYASLITADNLVRIKNSDPQYDSININKLIENNGISISRTIVEGEKEIIDVSYSLVADKKYFSSETQAKNFIKAVASTAVEENANKVKYLSYDTNLNSFDKQATLDSKIRFLREQYDFITTKYEELIKDYNNCVIKSKNKSIASYADEFKNAFDLQNSVDTLYGNLLKNIYVLDYDNKKEEYETIYNTYVALYESRNSKINDLKALINDIIQSLPDAKKDSLDLSKYNEELIKLSSQKREYEEMISYYENVLGKLDTTDPKYIARATNEESQKFLTSVNQIKEKLVEYTNILKEVENDVLNDNNNVYFTKTNVIYTSGNINAVIAIVISLALGLVVGCIVNLIIDHKKITNNELKANKDEE